MLLKCGCDERGKWRQLRDGTGPGKIRGVECWQEAERQCHGDERINDAPNRLAQSEGHGGRVAGGGMAWRHDYLVHGKSIGWCGASMTGPPGAFKAQAKGQPVGPGGSRR